MRIKSFKNLAFTLIELMLVILVVSFITLYSIQMINQNLLNKQTEKTVSEMLSIKSAVLAYYIKNKNWPTDLSTNLVPEFLPKDALCSSFIDINQERNSDCQKNIVEYQGKNPEKAEGYYELTLIVSSTNLASKLLNALPSAWLVNKTIHMAIPAPGAPLNTKNHGWIVSAGVVNLKPNTGANTVQYTADGIPVLSSTDLGPQIILPNCPAGYEGHIFLSPSNYQITDIPSITEQNIYVAMTKVVSSPINVCSPQCLQDSSSITTSTGDSIVSYYSDTQSNVYNEYPCNGEKNTQPNSFCGYTFDPTQPSTIPLSIVQSHDKNGNSTAMVVTAAVDTSTINHLAYFMTYCLPIGHWATNYIDPQWAQDGQCTQSWINYNYPGVNFQNPSAPPIPYCNIAKEQNASQNNIPYPQLIDSWNNSVSATGLMPVGDSRAF